MESSNIMKRFLLSTLAVMTALGPLAATTASADPARWNHNRDQWDGRGDDDRRGDHHRRGDWRRNDDEGSRGGYDRHRARWDDRAHNGYSYNGRWNYGPPPSAYDNRVDYGYREWRRGDRLPSYYRDRYRSVDYRDYDLRSPPRGYHYVEDDRGGVLLVGIVTGVILSTILNSHNDRYNDRY
jgi:Ni/Co efflux regulator RcnB